MFPRSKKHSEFLHHLMVNRLDLVSASSLCGIDEVIDKANGVQ